jgi:hypothetical protein
MTTGAVEWPNGAANFILGRWTEEMKKKFSYQKKYYFYLTLLITPPGILRTPQRLCKYFFSSYFPFWQPVLPAMDILYAEPLFQN